VFLDEFQDTTDIQYALVKECFFSSAAKITAVGDNKQRIMVWAGAVKTIFNDFHKELNPLGVRLIMNHRSAPRLVALQKAMYDSLKEKAREVAVSDKWGADDGDITLFIADDEQLEAEAVSEDILARISEGTKPNDICILCKQIPQNYAPAIIAKLEEHEVRARIENEYQDLIKEPIIDLLIKFMLCANNRKRPNEWNYIEESLVDLWGISETQDNDAYDKMQQKLVAQADCVKKTIHQGFDGVKWHDTLGNIISFFNVSKIKSKFPAYKQGTFLDELICKFEELFFKEYMAAYGEWDRAIENFCGEHSIPIMTIHKSKGLEYAAVYFVGLEDSAFWSFRNQPDEDRCTFFVALSRAKESVAFTFCKRRIAIRNPMQQHKEINEFFDLLQRPGVAEVKTISRNPNPLV
jgi:superfamily I DNA/RNA helicase